MRTCRLIGYGLALASLLALITCSPAPTPSPSPTPTPAPLPTTPEVTMEEAIAIAKENVPADLAARVTPEASLEQGSPNALWSVLFADANVTCSDLNWPDGNPKEVFYEIIVKIDAETGELKLIEANGANSTSAFIRAYPAGPSCLFRP